MNGLAPVVAVCLLGSTLTQLAVSQTMAPSGPAIRFGLSDEQMEILGHMSSVYLDDGQGGTLETLDISGINVRIHDGTGSTDGAINGLGNLTLGSNELRGVDDDRTGAHNLVVGRRSNYGGFGGFVLGDSSTIIGSHASVSGGALRAASDAPRAPGAAWRIRSRMG